MELLKDKPTCHISLPKFSIKKVMELKEFLTKLGATELFKANALAPGIVEGADNKLSEIMHKAAIEINEAGTKATNSYPTNV